MLEDSAYLTQSNGNLASNSKTSSASSLTGRFPSEESLERSPLKEYADKEEWSVREHSGKDEWDKDSNSSKVTSSSTEWYSEYRTQSFHTGSGRLDYVRTKSQYDEHIQHIRGLFILFIQEMVFFQEHILKNYISMYSIYPLIIIYINFFITIQKSHRF